MENIYKLYNGKNNDLLEIISWVNFAIGFDKSVMKFAKPDLFSLLENINLYDFVKFDDMECILSCLVDAFTHIQNNVHRNILRKHEIIHISQANEFDEKSIEWVARQNGISVRDKLYENKILAVRRKFSIDTHENRVVKSVILILRPLFDNPYFYNHEHFFKKMLRFVQDDLADVNHLGIIVENNILLHHKDYSKFYKASKWIARLRERVADFYKFRQEILDKKGEICKFIALANLHKFTKIPIKPSLISTNQDNYEIKFDDDFIINDNISNYVKFDEIVNLKEVQQKNLDFIESKIQIIDPPIDPLKYNKDKLIFADIFRFYPFIRISNQTLKMPLLLRQKIDNTENINANHSKIIIADTKFHAMHNILLNKNENLSIFLQDIRKTIGESENLYYILPDFINMFDFNESHKTIRSYFAKANFLQKSIVMASRFIFEKSVTRNTTLLFIQEDKKGQIFATPILVTYDERYKKSLTGGLCLVKYPTKHIEIPKGCEINNLQSSMQEKFGKTGIEELYKNGIKFYKNGELYPIEYNQNNNKKEPNLEIVKQKYSKFSKLFTKQTIVINDENNADYLENFQTLITEKIKGNILFSEHLPNLEIVVEREFEEINFSLVDESSELNDKNEIIVKNRFQIPSGATNVKAPLILDDGKIAFYMLLESKQMPFDKPLKCSLRLECNYEAENIYTLVFVPLDTNYQPMVAKWINGELKKEQKDMSKIYPPFVPQVTIDELKRYPKRDSHKTSNLFKWVEITLKGIMTSTHGFVYRICKDFCFVRDDENDEILCHKNRFIDTAYWENLKDGDILYFNKYHGNNGYYADNISISYNEDKNNFLEKNLKRLRFPMIKIFDRHTLQENEIPNSFRECIGDFSNFIEENFKNVTTDKQELILFYSYMHENCAVSNILIDKYNSIAHKYPQALAYSIGSCSQEWQKQIFRKALDNCQKIILSICLWRDKDLVFQIDEKIANQIIQTSLATMETKKNKNINLTVEIFLALLRLRSKGYNILNPSDEITKKIIKKLTSDKYKNKKLRSYLKLEVDKPEKYKNMDDLIYTLLSFIKGQNTNSIKILGTKDNDEF